MIRYLSPVDRKGASSVLVILMMVVLVLFGLSALTAGLASLRLTEKSGIWTEEYYLLEGKAESRVAEIDSILHIAETRAVEYIVSEEYLNESGTVFEDDLQKFINLNMTENLPDSAKAEYLQRVMKAVYYKSAYELMERETEDITIIYSNSMTRMILEDEGFPGMSFETTVSDGVKNIDIHADVTFPGYVIDFKRDKPFGIRSGEYSARYDIVVWEEWQEPFSYAENIQYAEPTKD
jgi:hypothetical protein